MQAARLHGIGDVRVADESDPADPAPGWSLVQVRSVGLCGSDLHWFEDGGIGDARLARPVVPGHEFGGIALSGPWTGHRVAVDPAIPCARCEQCSRGYLNLCPTVRFAGHGDLDGGLQQLITWPDDQLILVPDAISDDGVAMLEPLGVAIHSLDVAHLRQGDDVVIVGAGPIGLLCSALARRAGARRVFVIEPLEHRRDAAHKFGADDALDPATAREAIVELTGGRGVDVAIELAGNDDGVSLALDAARPGARVALAGIPSSDTTTFRASTARRKGLTLALVRRMNEVYPRAIELAATGGIDLDLLVDAHFGLADAAAAFAHASARRGLKTVVRVTAEPGR